MPILQYCSRSEVNSNAFLQVTFADTLGAAKHQEEDSEVNSKNEAKKLAFYLFWNIKPSFNRSAVTCAPSNVAFFPFISGLARLLCALWLRLGMSSKGCVVAAILNNVDTHQAVPHSHGWKQSTSPDQRLAHGQMSTCLHTASAAVQLRSAVWSSKLSDNATRSYCYRCCKCPSGTSYLMYLPCCNALHHSRYIQQVWQGPHTL